MQSIADFVNSFSTKYYIDSSMIQTMQGIMDKRMRVDGWISLILRNKKCVVLKSKQGIFMNEGYVLNDEKVLKV